MGCQMNEYDSNRILDLTKKIKYFPTKKIEEPVIKSEPPSPQFTKTDSFLASVVQSAKDLNIDLTEVPIAKPSPKQPKE